MERQGPVQRALKYETEMAAEAKEVIRICEYVEESRVKNPEPQVLIDLTKDLADLAAREHRLPLDLSYYVTSHKIYEMYIRILASTETPMNPSFMIKVAKLVNDEKLPDIDYKSALWNLVGGPVVWADGRKVTLTPEVREQFK